MFLGNFLIGSLQPAQQLGLVQAKNLKKLQIFCKKERLDKSAEAYLIEHSEGLEILLEYSLKNYGAFQNENNDLFVKHHRTNKELLLLFLQVVQPDFDYMMEMLQLFKDYPQAGELFKQSFEKLSEADKTEFINLLKQDKNLFCVFWKLIPIEITEVSLFEAFLDYYRNQSDVLKSYLSMFNLSQDFQKVLQRKQLWLLIKVYGDIHQDFLFSNPVDYCAFCRTELQMKFSVTVSAEAGIFEDEVMLLDLAARNCIFNHENKIRFIRLYERYLAEVEQYLSKYEQNLQITEDEQFDVIKENIRLIFALKNIFFKTEALLFEPENELVLLEYASKRRFQHHDNEIRFLLMGRKYPTEVEQYLTKHGKRIDFTEDEQLKFLQHQKNGIEHIKVQSPVVYRDYVLPEKRRKLISCTEEDLPMLIRLSLDNPLPLEQFIVEHGRVSPQLEAELFFRADEKCRKKYVELYGVNLRNLVKNAVQYGATETEQKLLGQTNFEKLSTYFTLLNKWKNFQKERIERMGRCTLGKKTIGLSKNEDCSVDLLCRECTALQEALLIVLPILINIAHRNYLLG